MLVIKQARLYTPKPEGVQDILVEGGKIARIAPAINEYDGIPEVEKMQLDGRRLAISTAMNISPEAAGNRDRGHGSRKPA